MTVKQNQLIYLILIVFGMVAGFYSIVNPIFEASDEVYHYPMVKHIADGDGLPVMTLETQQTPWRQEGGQPPLYYIVGASLTWWIDTSDMPDVRHINPHADVGQVLPDENHNMIAHNRDGFDLPPWRGTRLAIHIVRFYSIMLAVGTVFISYRLALSISNDHILFALLASTLIAFNPMFLFISSSVNNDNLSNLLAVWLLYEITKLIKRDELPTRRYYIQLGLLVGAGMLAKFQIGFMIIIIVIAFIGLAWKYRSWRPLLDGGFIAGGLTILIAGWWYWRNYDLYGDPTGIDVFLLVVGRRIAPPTLEQLWSERESFIRAFWGLFGGINVPFEPWVYDIFNIIFMIGLIGFVIYLVRHGIPSTRNTLAILLTVLWTVVVFVAYIRWTYLTPASQGRLMFVALAPIMFPVAKGWITLGEFIKFRLVAIVPVAYFLIIGVGLGPYTLYTSYAFPLEKIRRDNSADTVLFAETANVAPSIQSYIYPTSDEIRTNEYFEFDIEFEVIATMETDWSLYVHLINEIDIIEAQRDIYPGQGRLRTSLLGVGDTWRQSFAVKIPPGTYTPQYLTISYGFYNARTGQRMIAQKADGVVITEANSVVIGQVFLQSDDTDIPNEVNVNFDGKFLLQGYDISTRLAQSNEDVTIELYWQALADIDTPYTFSIQFINTQTAHKAAQSDLVIKPTAEADESFVDRRNMMIFPDTPPGIYQVSLTIYTVDDAGQIKLLEVKNSENAIVSPNFFYANQIRIVEVSADTVD